jgi:hypothetical protein
MPRHRHIEGLEAARLANEKREPVSLLPPQSGEKQLQESLDPSSNEIVKKAPPRLGKLGRRGDVILAPKAELQEHKATFRQVFGETLSDEFVDEMLTRLVTALAPGPWDVPEAATLNAAIALIASVKPQTELARGPACRSDRCNWIRQPQVPSARPAAFGGCVHRRLRGLRHSTDALAARADPSTGQAPAWHARQQADLRGPTCAYPSWWPGSGRHYQFAERRLAAVGKRGARLWTVHLD